MSLTCPAPPASGLCFLRCCSWSAACAAFTFPFPLFFFFFLVSFSIFLFFFFSNPAPVSRSPVLFSCLPSRFAQENASVARHESARLPRPPLPLLLAHRKHKPNPPRPPQHPSTPHQPPPPPPPATIHLFLEGKLSRLFCFFSYKISDGTFFFCCSFAVYFIFFFTVPKEKLLWV